MGQKGCGLILVFCHCNHQDYAQVGGAQGNYSWGQGFSLTHKSKTFNHNIVMSRVIAAMCCRSRCYCQSVRFTSVLLLS